MDLGSDKYEVIKPIATGGMAKVFLGRAKGTAAVERLVAMKVMHDHLTHEDNYVAMFLDEARLAARIRHPNVVATIDVVDGAVPFLVMDLVEGPTLRTLMKEAKKRDETIPIDVTLRIVSDTLLGLHAAHELCDGDGAALNIVHRDVSPHNVLVGNDGISRLADFGVAKAEVRIAITRKGHMKGKLAHAAPEQIAGEAVDRRADIYAAGSMLWEALTGDKRITAETQPTLVLKALHPKHIPPSEKREGVPNAYDAPCLRAMAVAPESRYATALEFADALEEVASSIGASVASPREVAQYVATFDFPEISGPDSSQSLDALSGRSLGEARSTTAPSVRSMDITAQAIPGAKRWNARSAVAGAALTIAVVGVLALGVSMATSESTGGGGETAESKAPAKAPTEERKPPVDVPASPTGSDGDATTAPTTSAPSASASAARKPVP